MASGEERARPPQQQAHQPGRESEMQPAPDTTPRYPGSGRLEGKVAIVTGGDSGIGRATARLFAREGANVVILYKDEDEDAQATVEMVEQEGRKALAVRGDIADPKVAENCVKKTVDTFGRLDVLVNNASEQHMQKDVRKITQDQLVRTFSTNIFGMFYMTQAALDHMKEGSAIVNVTSITAFRGNPVLVDYSSTKGAILAFTRALADNLVKNGIRVNCVAPGPIWTPLIPASFPADKVATFGKDTPIGRAGQPNEVAPAILFLACEDSSYMAGQTLHPNGGTVVGG